LKNALCGKEPPQILWTLIFIGVTTFYDSINNGLSIFEATHIMRLHTDSIRIRYKIGKRRGGETGKRGDCEPIP